MTMRIIHVSLLVLALAVLTSGCGDSTPSEKAAAPPVPAEKPAPPDLSRHMSSDGRESVELVREKLLGVEDLPGATLVTYKRKGKDFQQFLMKAPSVALTAVYLNDIKKAMANPKFIAGYGGYFGEIQGKPVFVFVKNEYVAGLIGLSQEEADAEGRLVAARIP